MMVNADERTEEEVVADMRERVRAGGRGLDTLLADLAPVWAAVIDLDHLNVRSTRYCVIGQLDRLGLLRTSPLLALGDRFPDLLGFDLSQEDRASSVGHDALWGHLDALWRAEITARRAERPAGVEVAP